MNRCFACLRVFHQFDDLRQRRIFANASGVKLERTCFVERAADDVVACFLFNGQALTGEHRFIHRAITFFDDSIYGNAFAGADENQIVNLYFVRRDFFFFVVTNNAGDLRLELHQFANRFGRAPAC